MLVIRVMGRRKQGHPVRGLERIPDSEVAANWRKVRVRPDLADIANVRAKQAKISATAIINRALAEAFGASLDGLIPPEVVESEPIMP